MMTDAMKPLAISLLSNVANFIKEDPGSSEKSFILAVGGRAFADISGALMMKPSRKMLLKVFRGMDELMAAAISEVIKREEFCNSSIPKKEVLRVIRKMAPILIPVMSKVKSNLLIKDPSKAREHVNFLIEKIVQENEKTIFEATGAERIRKIKQSMGNMAPKVLAKVAVYIIAGVLASGELEKKLKNPYDDPSPCYDQ